MMLKGCEIIANFLEEKNIKHVFGIIGAGNANIFDAIYRKGFTEIICVHHEQVACMAMQTYFRIKGQISAAILTTGAGSTNGITGVVSAWADSIPGIVISGNENSKYIDLHNKVRMWGVQGYDSSLMVKNVTKYASRILKLQNIWIELNKAFDIALEGRMGPTWIDVPLDMQSESIDKKQLLTNKANSLFYTKSLLLNPDQLEQKVKEIVLSINGSKRPLFWFGNGIRLAQANNLLEPLLNQVKIPALVSWAGLDMIDSNHPYVFGRAGTYGQRCANLVLQNCDMLICVGTRLSISQIGYDIKELARNSKIAVIDIDQNEIDKLNERCDFSICADAKEFLTTLIKQIQNVKTLFTDWVYKCNQYKKQYPWVTEWEHPDKDGYINSYRFLEKFNNYFKSNQIIVTDMGTALLSGHQVIKISQSQRLLTSTGLGEMGYALPAAIGASFASNKGEVLCLNCDGGMMLNLQELQTIVHHKLPIKIIIFNNDGYLMIKHTQNALFNGRRAGVDEKSGVSCPNFCNIATAFNIPSYQIRTWEDCDKILPIIQKHEGFLICEVFMHPLQMFVPKLSLAIQQDGSLISPPLEDLSPFISREKLNENMINGLHEKSKNIRVI